MKPRKNYVLVGEVAEEMKTESGIILTRSMDKGSKPGKVMAVGPDADVEIGSEVALNWKEGLPITVQGTQMILISEEHILGVY